MKISLILGTRPEIIKMSPIVTYCENLNLNYFILHTGQHYSYAMDKVFFDQLRLPKAKYNLDIGSGSHAVQTGRMLIGIEKILIKEKVDLVLAQGDTNTVLAAVLAASKLGINVGHVESGLRSNDIRMPEEINRVLADHSSDILFAPTEQSKVNLLNEGISSDKIFVTGNTIVDAIFKNIQIAQELRSPSLIEDLGFSLRTYGIVTLHRQENVDNKFKLGKILEGLCDVVDQTGVPLIFPIHPRTKKMMSRFSLGSDSLILIEPLDYFSFLILLKNSRIALTDSGGVQEETCTLGIPCVTLRDNTERPETLEIGANILTGIEPEEIVEKTKIMLNCKLNWNNPFGDGDAGSKIIDIIRDKFN